MKFPVLLVAGLAIFGLLDFQATAQTFVSDYNNGSGQQVRRFDDNGASIPPVPFLNAGGGGPKAFPAARPAVSRSYSSPAFRQINVYNKDTGRCCAPLLSLARRPRGHKSKLGRQLPLCGDYAE